MPEATMRAIEYAKKHDVPVVLTLGTKFVIEDDPQWWRDFLRDHVTVVAMNEDEAEALTGEADPLVASEKKLLNGSTWYCAPQVQLVCIRPVIPKMKRSVKRACHYCLVISLNSIAMSLAVQC